MVTLPEPESGTKRSKLTTPKYGVFAMVLSAEQYTVTCQKFKCIFIFHSSTIPSVVRCSTESFEVSHDGYFSKQLCVL